MGKEHLLQHYQPILHTKESNCKISCNETTQKMEEDIPNYKLFKPNNYENKDKNSNEKNDNLKRSQFGQKLKGI